MRLSSREPGMTISAKHLHFDEDSMWVELTDGRTLGVPLVWLPRRLNAPPEQRLAYAIIHDGLHWNPWMKTFPFPACWRGAEIKPNADLRPRERRSCVAKLSSGAGRPQPRHIQVVDIMAGRKSMTEPARRPMRV